MKRAQLELWMLTKMAMLFFIVSLAFIAFNISNTEKAALCGEQAISTARIIASSINQVLSSDIEDERLVYKLDAFLAVGKDKFERYDVILQSNDQGNRVQLSVIISPKEAGCTRSVSVFYDKSKVDSVRYVTPVANNRRQVDNNTMEFKLEPSTPDLRQRSNFLVITKCHIKQVGGKIILHFDDCRNQDSAACSPIETLEGCRVE